MIFKVKCSRIWVCAIVVLVAVTVIITIVNIASPSTNSNSTYNVLTQNTPSNNKIAEKINKIRGVWVPYMSLETSEHTEKSFKNNFDKIVDTAKKHKMNALIVHVRPFSDALYNSEIFPSSHIVTGEQGKKLDFDPLKYMVEKAHSEGLTFHAWINPYRISTSDTPKKLSENSIVNTLGDENILLYDGGKYINPASTKGKELIIKGVKEIVENYDVDGIQFDDYFYPSSETALDAVSYNNYKDELDDECTALTPYEWRKSNVNMLISSVYQTIKSTKNNVVFGISPQGNINNCLEIGADIYTWCNTYGYVDYICPQIYVNFEHSVLPFDTMLKQWQEATQSGKTILCIGLALYKAGSNDDEGTWQNSNEILKKEVEYCKEQKINSFMIYDIDYFTKEETEEEVKNVMSVL